MKKNRPSVLSLIYLIPILDLLSFLGINTNLVYITKGAILVLFTIQIIIEKKQVPWLLAVLGLPLLIILYNYSKGFDILKPSVYLINIILLPLVMLLNKEDNNTKRLWLLSWEYIIVFSITFLINSNINEFRFGTISVLSLSIPWLISQINNHNNLVSKYIGIVLIMLFAYLSKSILFTLVAITTICYYLWVSSLKKDKESLITSLIWFFTLLVICLTLTGMKNDSAWLDNTYSKRINEITNSYNNFLKTNIDEQLFGTISLKNETVRTDGVELFLNIGYIGATYYVILLIISVIKTRKQKNFIVPWTYLIFLSIINGSVITNWGTSIMLFLIITKKENIAKKILMVSNMYPSKRNKHYGAFVKNMVIDLANNGYDIEVVKITKHKNKLLKLLAYLKLYFVAFLKSFLYSYDYFYSHFISHSTLPLIPARIVSPKTLLIANAHGNDIVADNAADENNIASSKSILKYVDRVVVPSAYYKEIIIEDYRFKENNIYIYPSGGIDFTIFKDLNKRDCLEELGLDEKYTYYGFISRIEKDKGWDTLIEAFNILNNDNKLNNIKLIIIGRGAEEQELTNLIKEYKLDNLIIRKEFVYQDELVKYYNAFDALIFPTKRKSESLGLVGLEAMACHTPTIICTLYGPKSYANKSNSLVYTKTKDGKELANKIKEYMKLSSKDKETLINNAYNTSKEYDKDSIKDALQKIFDKGE